MIKYVNKDYIPHYKVGMYGGKFLPMHKGHLYCIETASNICDKVYLILFSGGTEERFERKLQDKDIYSVESRYAKITEIANRFNNVVPTHIDVTNCTFPDGNEDWDAETPLVLNSCGRFNAVFGSELSYASYFERAYPWADYVIIDMERKHVPISATTIRHKLTDNEAKQWIV